MTDTSFVTFGCGTTVQGPKEAVKAMVEVYVDAKVGLGSGALVNNASDDLTEFLLALRKRFPWNGHIDVSFPKGLTS